MPDDIKLVYTGSRVEAMFLKDMLEENGIGSIFKDTPANSLHARWADGTPPDGLFVETSNNERAKNLITEYFKSRDK